MNKTSAELVSIQALCPASAAASAFVLTVSSVTGGVAGAAVGSCEIADREIANKNKAATANLATRRNCTSSANRSITEVSHSRRIENRAYQRAVIDSAL